MEWILDNMELIFLSVIMVLWVCEKKIPSFLRCMLSEAKYHDVCNVNVIKSRHPKAYMAVCKSC